MSKYDQVNPSCSRRGFQNQTGPAVVLEALEGLKMLPQLASEFGIHAQQITDWKKQALDQFPSLFESSSPNPTLSCKLVRQPGSKLKSHVGILLGNTQTLTDSNYRRLPDVLGPLPGLMNIKKAWGQLRDDPRLFYALHFYY